MGGSVSEAEVQDSSEEEHVHDDTCNHDDEAPAEDSGDGDDAGEEAASDDAGE